MRTMERDVGAAVDRLMRSYSGYYDVSPCDEGDLVARAEFHSRGEKYLLVRGVNQLLAVLALLAVCAWLGNIGKNNRMIYIPMMFMLAATLSSLVLTMWSKTGDLSMGFDGVAAAQLVISALLFVLAVFLMAEGLKVLNEQRRARMSEETS